MCGIAGYIDFKNALEAGARERANGIGRRFRSSAFPARELTRGFDTGAVNDVINKVTFGESNRRQAAPGLKASPRAFGSGRRIPVARRFRAFDFAVFRFA